MDRLLIVEDDLAIRQFIRRVLEGSGYEVLEAATLREGLASVGFARPDMIILDLGLPDGDGIELIQETQHWNHSPFLVLSARASDADKTTALDGGADDYLVKPFSSSELLARVRASLRRAHRPDADRASVIRFGECEFDQKARAVHRQGRPIHLTKVELKLLAILVANERQVFTHRQLLRVVWGPSASDHVHYLRIYMRHLRRKLEVDPARPVHFLTEIGVGYRFVPNPPTGLPATDAAAESSAKPDAGAVGIGGVVGSLDDLVSPTHILRSISDWVGASWPECERRHGAPHADGDLDAGSERLVRALLLQLLYRIPDDRQLLEQIHNNMLYRWFVGLTADDPVWHFVDFRARCDSLAETPPVRMFLHAAFDMLESDGHLFAGHFLVDRALLQEWRGRIASVPNRRSTPAASPMALAPLE